MNRTASASVARPINRSSTPARTPPSRSTDRRPQHVRRLPDRVHGEGAPPRPPVRRRRAERVERMPPVAVLPPAPLRPRGRPLVPQVVQQQRTHHVSRLLDVERAQRREVLLPFQPALDGVHVEHALRVEGPYEATSGWSSKASDLALKGVEVCRD
eukprot:31085-Pelagococcus_subviridis.AAC.4